jgi:hypothetical protein
VTLTVLPETKGESLEEIESESAPPATLSMELSKFVSLVSINPASYTRNAVWAEHPSRVKLLLSSGQLRLSKEECESKDGHFDEHIYEHGFPGAGSICVRPRTPNAT